MISLSSFVILLVSIHCSVIAQHDEEIPKIGIIGGGLGGTSVAYFLRELFGSKLQVDVIEADRVGGRLALINIDGQEYEAGGMVIHPKNAHMVNFTQLFGLERMEDLDGTLGLYSSHDGLFFQTSTWLPVTIAKMVWRYGWDVKRIKDWVAEMLLHFGRIYDYQRKRMAFTTVEDLLRAMNEQFVNYTRISGRQMLKDAGFGNRFMEELVFGAMRDNYGQTADVHGFVTAVSLAGVEPGLWRVKGGNKNVAEKLLKASGANLVQGTAIQVDQIYSGGGSVSYEVKYLKEGGMDTGTRDYDILIMATPLRSGSKLKIKFEDFPEQFTVPDIPFHSLDVAFVHGRPNISFFGVATLDDFPTQIITTDSGVFFNALGKQAPVKAKEHLAGKPDDVEGYAVWKSFLNKVPSEQQLSCLFDSRKDLRLVNWLAYPQYTPDMELPSFVLHDRLYYINAIEAAASAMEMSVIGAQNVALLAYNQWHGHFERIDEVDFPTDKDIPSAGDGHKVDEL